jgi:hypothetical protein
MAYRHSTEVPLLPPGTTAPYTYQPHDDVDPDYENVLKN